MYTMLVEVIAHALVWKIGNPTDVYIGSDEASSVI